MSNPLSSSLKAPKVLMIGYVWPEPQSSAAGLRQMNLIETFLSAGWQLIFASGSRANSACSALQDLGITTYAVEANDPNFDSMLLKEQPDYVIFDRFVIEEQFGWRVQEVCPNAIRVLDLQDLHFLRRTRENKIKESHCDLSEFQGDFHSEDALREIASIYRCDTTLTLSSFEQNILSGRLQISKEALHLSRFHYNSPPVSLSFDSRKDFVMIGNFRHRPNVDGLFWFLKEIWPIIHKAVPHSAVHVYGAYPTKNVMELSNSSRGVCIQGQAEDPFQTLQKYRVNLAPLRFGAGIKGKISDGWWAGTPVVTTPLGAEGMADTLPWGGEIAFDANEYAEKAINLYSNLNQWKTAQENGYHIIRTLYGKETNEISLLSHLTKIRNDIAPIRDHNLIGAMLKLHQFRSTKYFSKWIEEKNTKMPSPQ